MGISTSTGTLAAGTSKTFNLSPGSAVTLVMLPNCRVAVREIPNIPKNSPLGGDSEYKDHAFQMGQTFTFGPYVMGGDVVVTVAANSNSSVSWVREDSIMAVSASGSVSLVDEGGNSYALAQDATATVMPDEIVRLTASGCANASPCYISRIRCVNGTSIALTVYDNAAASSGTQLYSGTLSAGQDAALSAAKVRAINGVRLAWTGTATFDVSTGQEAA